MKFLTAFYLCLVLSFGFASIVNAQDGASLPALPAPLQALQDEGAQLRYLGNHNGLDGWVTIRAGQEQYFYVTEDGQSLLMGLLFDADGSVVTARQVQQLKEKSGAVLDLFAQDNPQAEPQKEVSFSEFKTPAEQLYSDMTNSNWIALGDESAPAIYTFIDPQCPHCHAFIKDLKEDYIDAGKLQVRMVPVGFLGADAKAQAAFLLAIPNPEDRWYRHLEGDESALPVAADINDQGVERNMSIMQAWKFDMTPLTIYKNRDGEVKIVQGQVRSAKDIINDL